MAPETKSVSYASASLRRLRQSHSLSQEDMANRMQVSLNTYRDLEKYPPELESEERLKTKLLKDQGEDVSSISEDKDGKYRHPSYALSIARIFDISVEELLFKLHLAPEEELDIENVQWQVDIGDTRDHPSAEHNGRYVPVAAQYAIHSLESLNLRMLQENESAEQFSLGLLRLPVGMEVDSGSFAYVWTDEFENSRDALPMGELIFINTSLSKSSLEQGALYVIKDRSEVMLRRAVSDGKKWHLVSDHWNARHLSATERDSRVYGRVYRFSELMKQYLQRSASKESKVVDNS